MPTYEYRCDDCREDFSLIMSMSEYGSGQVACPRCGGRNVSRKFSVFYAKTSKKS